MNNRPSATTSANHNKNDIDLVSFDRRKRTEQIRMNEEAERQKRMMEQKKRRRAERIRQAKIARLKALCTLAVMGVGTLCIVIAIIVTIIKAATAPKKTQPESVNYAVSKAETLIIDEFAGKTDYFTSSAESTLANSYNDIFEAFNSPTTTFPTITSKINEYGDLSERYLFSSTGEHFKKFKEAVKSAPVFSNGYIWSEADNMKSTVTNGYMYDTNTSFIIAVSNICLAEGTLSFLDEIDTDTQPKKDVSRGKTVGEKLNMAIDYLFDSNIIDGGVKFDPISSLCYIHTSANSGTSSGLPSNRWHNFRFGYLDAYTNISFFKAMNALTRLYLLSGDVENSQKYSDISKKHAKAFNEKFWDTSKQRYIGCFDKNDKEYDYGFVFLNLEAIVCGIADNEKTSQILSWIDGERIIDTDTSTGTDIYSFGFAPRNTTLAVTDSWWDYIGGTLPLSGDGAFGEYYQNGGVSLSNVYYDILAHDIAKDYAKVSDRITSLSEEYKKTNFTNGYENRAYNIKEDALGGLVQTAVLKSVYGLSYGLSADDGLYLEISPNKELITHFSGSAETYGIKGIGFSFNEYGFIFRDGKIYITAAKARPIKIKIGGLESNTVYQMVKVDNYTEVSKLPFTTNNDGVLTITSDFGASSYLRIEKTKAEN